MNKSMMAVAKLKIDDKGRITLPKYFLIANGLMDATEVLVYPVYNNPMAIKLDFDVEEPIND